MCNGRARSFNHETCPLIPVHMFSAQKASFDRSPRFGKAFHENKFYLLLIGYVLHLQGASFDCSICIYRPSFFGVLVLACKYAYECFCTWPFVQDGVCVTARGLPAPSKSYVQEVRSKIVVPQRIKRPRSWLPPIKPWRERRCFR